MTQVYTHQLSGSLPDCEQCGCPANCHLDDRGCVICDACGRYTSSAMCVCGHPFDQHSPTKPHWCAHFRQGCECGRFEEQHEADH